MSSTFVLFRNRPNKLHSTDLRKKLHKIIQIAFHFLSRGATRAFIQGDSAPTVSFGVMVIQNRGGTSPPLVPSFCTEHTFRFGTTLELPLIFTSFPFQSSSAFLLFSFYLYSWGSICYFNFLFNCISKLWPSSQFSLLMSFSISSKWIFFHFI